MEPTSQNTGGARKENGGNVTLGIIAVVVVVLVIVGIVFTSKKTPTDTAVVPTDTNTDTTSTTTPVTTPVATTTDNKKFLYKNGTYTAVGNYNSPGGAEQIQITLMLKDDVVTDAQAVSLATRPESKINQAKFMSGFQAVVIGKNINDLNLTKVSGSSLTPQGFNDAVAKIKVQAKIS